MICWDAVQKSAGLATALVVVLAVAYDSGVLAIAVVGAEVVMYCLGVWHGMHIAHQGTACDLEE